MRRSAQELVARLHRVANRFGGEWTAKKSALLEKCAAIALDDAQTLLAYHDVLLFMLAYPESRPLYQRARHELRRVADAARRFAEAKNGRVRRMLWDSGVAWSEQSIAFGYDVAAWLSLTHSAIAEIDYSEEGPEALQEVLRLCLPSIEADLFDVEFPDIDSLLDQAKGSARASRLAWLIAQLQRLPSRELRKHLFESLHLYVKVSPKDGPLSRTFARGLPARIFFHSKELRRDVTPSSAIDVPIPAARRLTARDRATVLDAGRGVLAVMGRETDPISAARSDGVEYRELGRGVTIAFYSACPESRAPIDTHVGFVLFMNAIPVAYGGGWPFLEQCGIGVNVLEPFRGGESAYLFCQVLRAYRQRFDVSRFVAEPYQFGAGNREGLLSGAFWFYYRLGFRPAGRRQAALADAEFAKIQSNARYRTPLNLMRRLTRSALELRLARDEATPWPNPALLSRAATAWIGHRFAGDRAAAQAASIERLRAALKLGAKGDTDWPPGERHSFRVLSPLIAMIADLERWPEHDRRSCLAMMRAKGAKNEALYFRLARRHPRLRNALNKILEGR